MGALLASQAHIPAGSVITVQYGLSHIAETTTQATVNKALQFAEYAWYDVMIGFKEIGYDPSPQEKNRIMERLFTSKLKNLLQKENGQYGN